MTESWALRRGDLLVCVRGLTYARQASPAQVLASLDQAMRGLAVDTYATAILAHIERDQFKAQWGLRTLRWCNAGEPPAVLVAPDGHSGLLEARPDLLLGLGGGERADHTLTLAPGSSLVFYTDGLVERREIPLDDRLHSLGDTLAGRKPFGCGAVQPLLAQLDSDVEDDVALLAPRLYPEGRTAACRGPSGEDSGSVKTWRQPRVTNVRSFVRTATQSNTCLAPADRWVEGGLGSAGKSSPRFLR